jgi:RNA polymerase sigma-70 factor (ECF subfamily)
MPHNDDAVAEFENARPRLWGLAYRMLGSRADADDAVQDTFLRWQGAARGAIDKPQAWLTAVCTRRCLDMLRAAHRTRVDYVGPWLPEPIVADESVAADPAAQAELASSLSLAFLVVLDRLTPPERAAFLLREVFDYDYDVVSEILGKTPAACRQIVSRARRRLPQKGTAPEPPAAQDNKLLDEFLGALRSGDASRIEGLLAEDVALWADGGGKVPAALNVIEGSDSVARFIAGVWRKGMSSHSIERVAVNGDPGLMFRENGELVTVMSLVTAPDGRIAGIFAQRNPDKLART